MTQKYYPTVNHRCTSADARHTDDLEEDLPDAVYCSVAIAKLGTIVLVTNPREKIAKPLSKIPE